MFTIIAITPDPSDIAVWPQEMERVIQGELDRSAQEVQKELLEPTGEWNHKPKAQIEAAQHTRLIYIADEVYGYINNGTEPHEITAIRKHALRFYTGGFVAKTAPGSLGSRPGMEGGETVFRRGVHHPGTAPRGWDILIEQEWNGGKFQERMQYAIDAIK